MAKTETTQSQWNSLMEFNPSENKKCSNCPVENITWEDAVEYTRRLSEKTGNRYRLPSESEWEYACRANQNLNLCGSNSQNEISWNAKNSDWRTHTVAKKIPNAFGLYDMSGNVAEWVEDCYDANHYFSGPKNGRAFTRKKCSEHVAKGGSFQEGSDDGKLRAASRSGWSSDYSGYGTIGFRVVREIDNSSIGENINISKFIPLPNEGHIIIYSDGLMACFDSNHVVTTDSTCKRPSIENENKYIKEHKLAIEKMQIDAGKMLVDMVRGREAEKTNKEIKLRAEEQKRGTVEYCLSSVSSSEIQVKMNPNWATIIGFVISADGKNSQNSKAFNIRAFDDKSSNGMAYYKHSGQLKDAVAVVLDKYKTRYSPNTKKWFSQRECN